jgi:hypothetical protein
MDGRYSGSVVTRKTRAGAERVCIHLNGVPQFF